MSFSLLAKFFANARGVTFKDGGAVTWSFNPNTNEISAVASGGGGISETSGTYTGTLTGCATAPTTTVKWVKTGSKVTITIAAVTAVSNANTFTITGSMPASIQPATLQYVAVSPIEDNGGFVFQAAAGVAPGSSTITFGINGSAAGWTASGTKGVSSNISFTYQTAL